MGQPKNSGIDKELADDVLDAINRLDKPQGEDVGLDFEVYEMICEREGRGGSQDKQRTGYDGKVLGYSSSSKINEGDLPINQKYPNPIIRKSMTADGGFVQGYRSGQNKSREKRRRPFVYYVFVVSFSLSVGMIGMAVIGGILSLRPSSKGGISSGSIEISPGTYITPKNIKNMERKYNQFLEKYGGKSTSSSYSPSVSDLDEEDIKNITGGVVGWGLGGHTGKTAERIINEDTDGRLSGQDMKDITTSVVQDEVESKLNTAREIINIFGGNKD